MDVKRIDSLGRLGIPVSLRRHLGLTEKSKVVMYEQDGKLVIEKLEQYMKGREE